MLGVGLNAKLQTIMDNVFSLPWMGLQLWNAAVVIKPQGHRETRLPRGLWRPVVWPPAQSRVHQEVRPDCPRLYPIWPWKPLIIAIECWLWRAIASFLDSVKCYRAGCNCSVSSGTCAAAEMLSCLQTMHITSGDPLVCPGKPASVSRCN